MSGTLRLPLPASRARVPLAAVASLAAFSAAAVGAGLGRALVTTYLPVLLADIRDSPGLIGTVLLVNTVAGFVVPLWVGLWSDRLHANGRTRTGPFILGGSLLAAGGLGAIALGHASTYLLLALAAAVVYTGLNAITTAHRALIPETFGEDGRAAATAAEELAVLAGSLAGVLAGGILLELASWSPFALGAALVPLLALPTIARMRGREVLQAREPQSRTPLRYYRRAATTEGARLVLAAQLLWVLGYIALPPFFVLYADRELGLRPSVAAVLLGAFGVVTGVAMLGAGAVPPRHQARTVLLGVVLLGGGLAGASTSTTLAFVAPALLAAAVGFGLVTTLGFPVFSRYIPPGEEGAYTAVFFAVRAVAGAIALPAAGWTISLAGSYRAPLAAGGGLALLALLPLARLDGASAPLRRPPIRRLVALVGGLLALTASLLALALVTERTRLMRAEVDVFDALYGLGGTPRLLDELLVDPHVQNYVALVLVTLVAALLWRPEELVRVLSLVPLAGLVSFALVRLLWAVWERGRPEEVIGVVPANGHLWAPYPSFPSGHVAVTVALAAAAATRVPWLGPPLFLYAGVIAVTRISYGAHFPLDVVAGAVIGLASARVVAALLTETRLASLPRAVVRPHPVTVRAAALLRRLGLAGGAAAVLAFGVLAVTRGAPVSPDGGVLGAATEQTVQYVLVALAGAAVAAAAWRPAVGGVALLPIAAAIGMLAAVEHDPLFAAGAFAAFFAPSLLLLVGAELAVTSRGLAVVAATATGVALVGAFGAFRVHALAFGPTHPESTTRAPPLTVVRWSWAGAVTETGFRVVAKLTRDGDARLLVSADADLSDATRTPPRRALHAANDRVVAFDVTGLEPGRRYVYAVESHGVVDRARAGTVRTFPRGPASFSFAYGGCARVGSNGAVYDAIRRRDPLFFLVLGDFFYANIEGDDAEAFRGQYDRTLSRPAQAALYRSTAVDYVWDDHDFGPNDADSTAKSRPAALAAYRSLAPHYPLPDGGTIYHAFTVGRVRVLVTDTRSARTAASMLGARQRAWLKRELLAADRRGQLAVWVNSVPWIAASGDDTWAGYPRERRELADFVAAHGLRNVVMLSGDAHMAAIDDGTNNRYAASGETSFPVAHGAALDRRGDVKGGPYSEGAFPGSGQFGTVSVVDTGGAAVRVTLAGWNHRGERLLSYSFTRTLGDRRG